jgi:hypothetical protein
MLTAHPNNLLRPSRGTYRHVPVLSFKQRVESDDKKTQRQVLDKARKMGWVVMDHLFHPVEQGMARVLRYPDSKATAICYPDGEWEARPEYRAGWFSPAAIEKAKQDAKDALQVGVRRPTEPLTKEQVAALLKSFKQHK